MAAKRPIVAGISKKATFGRPVLRISYDLSAKHEEKIVSA
jgi:hypothetical protein